MKQRHIVEAGMVVLSGVVALVVALMWLAGTYSVTLMTAMAVLIMLGVLVWRGNSEHSNHLVSDWNDHDWCRHSLVGLRGDG
ncbi:hypothetical protein [Limosilactobacillus fermentum]|uniref:hypothetical protein n=1 Tax=Limosilactobacillus fermentum TaxID=1613 RepID=UPI002F26C301